MKRTGMSLIEVLVATAVVLIVFTGVAQSANSIFKVSQFSTTMPSVQEDAVRAVNTVSTYVRRAPLCANVGCITDSAVKSAAANSLEVYSTSRGAVVSFKVEDGKFIAKSGDSVITTVPNVTSMELKYSIIDDASYTTNSARNWTTSVSSENLKKIAAVWVRVNVKYGDMTGVYDTAIRLRNSPKLNAG